MKRVLALLLILALLTPLAGCHPADDALEASASQPEATPTAAPLPTDIEPPEPTPEPTPVPIVGYKEYAFETFSDENLKFSFKYPSHWALVEGNQTISYVQPVNEGELPARLSITWRDAGNIIVTKEVAIDQMNSFKKSLKNRRDFTNFASNKKNNKRFKFAGNTGFSFIYTAELDGVPIKGYCAIAYSKPKRNRFYVLHFYCPAGEYKSFEKIRKTIVKSVKI